MSPYQDVYRGGRVITRGERDCVPRYRLIEALLPSEPFTLLDLGAAGGYFAARIAHEFDAHVTAVDNDRTLREVASDRVTVWSRRLNVAQLWSIRRHDVALALSVLHHFTDWHGAFDALRACRRSLIVEIPHPDENWMIMAKARHELGALHDHVSSLSTRVGSTPRVGRNGVTYQRPLFVTRGTVTTYTGRVFAGSGNCADGFRRFAEGIDRELGYVPFPGSLNLKLDHTPQLGTPLVDWRPGKLWQPRRDATLRVRDYQLWKAWIDDVSCHAMRPGGRGHRDSIEVVARTKLRDTLQLSDGDEVHVDVMRGE